MRVQKWIEMLMKTRQDRDQSLKILVCDFSIVICNISIKERHYKALELILILELIGIC